MSKIHEFQRYSSVENTVTNNTLRLFARIYQHQPQRAAQLLSDLIGEEIDIGVLFSQQSRGVSSVPDGSISQPSFKILIESKVDASPSQDQILRHAAGFEGEQTRILVLLTREPITRAELAAIRLELANKHSGVVFNNVTYEEICAKAADLFRDHEVEMVELVDDYQSYCETTNLFDHSRVTMRIVPCGNSAALNLRHAMYFQPVERGYRPHAFVGIYNNKSVRALLEIDSVFDVTLTGDQLERTCVAGRNTDEYDERLRAMIAEAQVECNYEIATEHRFFCARQATPTDYRKDSPGGIMGARFVNLRSVIGNFDDVGAAARLLAAKSWL